ncbi:ABC transporter ATP-binding protein [uncultured Nitratireductor sp.]|mgnify:CR=1 FL=1|uniref:ABC transporter ATP-binding protein n=1 Tax=uncultured Nitratireductor sp. TaxID=520953 RepID=UPI0025D2524A|nr:ABC transporter ATP-binding protein [uncultured Nitratireductor sp.]
MNRAAMQKTNLRHQSDKPLLQIADLGVSFPGVGEVVRDLGLALYPGEAFGIVGESGSGKSMLARAVMQLLPKPGKITSGRILFKGTDLANLKPGDMRRVRGSGIGMVFQEPMTSLNPSMTIGAQITEGLRTQGECSRQALAPRIHAMLERVRIADPEGCLKKYPHEFSGGMRQRILLASVLLMQPDLLIADEPTTALDAVIQKEVLEIMSEVTRDLGVALMLISHDLGAVGAYTERLMVMRKGELVEEGATSDILLRPQHPYTVALIEALPSREKSWRRDIPAASGPLVEVENLRVVFERKSFLPWAKPTCTEALKGVSLTVGRSETVAVVGESGSGKTTLGRAILRLIDHVEGDIRVAGEDVYALSAERLLALRRQMQIVFQDPYSSLDPRRRIGEIVSEGLRHVPDVTRAEYRDRARQALAEVDLSAEYLGRFPHQLSGGQRQRVCIARALIMKPKLIVADEPVSALDITVQAKILELMKRLQVDHGFAYLFISHDLGVVEQIADRVIVMQAGRIVEHGARDMIFDQPRHPYTRLLLKAVPDLHRSADASYRIGTRAYSQPTAAPDGMVFDWAEDGNDSGGAGGAARLIEVADGHFVSCRPGLAAS